MRWKRYQAVIVGWQSGTRQPLSFVRFRHAWQADDWCHKMTLAAMEIGPVPLVEFRYELIPTARCPKTMSRGRS